MEIFALSRKALNIHGPKLNRGAYSVRTPHETRVGFSFCMFFFILAASKVFSPTCFKFLYVAATRIENIIYNVVSVFSALTVGIISVHLQSSWILLFSGDPVNQLTTDSYKNFLSSTIMPAKTCIQEILYLHFSLACVQCVRSGGMCKHMCCRNIDKWLELIRYGVCQRPIWIYVKEIKQLLGIIIYDCLCLEHRVWSNPSSWGRHYRFKEDISRNVYVWLYLTQCILYT